MEGRHASQARDCRAFRVFAFRSPSAATELKVVSTTAFKGVLEELGPQFEKTTENKVSFTFAPTVVLKTQIEPGAPRSMSLMARRSLTSARSTRSSRRC
jgi:ABC-type molybdate transport system substrate-binding protein